MKNIRLLLFVLLLTLGFCPLFSAPSEENILITEKSPGRIVFEWTVPELEWETIRNFSGEYVIPRIGELPLYHEPGYPVLPRHTILFENARNENMVILDTVYTTIQTGRICPAPTTQFNPSGQSVEEYYKEDPDVYSVNKFYPGRFLTGENGGFQGRQLFQITIHPVQYNPVTGTIRYLRYIKVQLTGSGSTIKKVSIDKINRIVDKNVAGKLNHAVAPYVSSAETGPWWEFNMGRELLKILTVDEGVYKISGRMLQQLGLNIYAINPEQIRIFNRGIEQACDITGGQDSVLNPEDQIIFFASRLSGDSSYFNAYSDTNVYWLTWGGEDGKRYVKSVSSSVTNEKIDFYPCALHLEEDSEYYHGDTNVDIHETEQASGEGWVWTKTFYSGTIYNFPFDLPGLFGGGDSIDVRVRLRGTTYSNEENDHHVRLYINNNLIFDSYFDDREELIAIAEVPAAFFKEYGNQMDIQSVNDTNVEISQFYLDWFEFVYKKRLTTANGWLRFAPADGGIEQSYFVNGFSMDTIRIWDLNKFREIIHRGADKSWLANIRVMSAGIFDGNYASFWINNQNLYNGHRGINIVTIDQHSGRVLKTAAFDTWESSEQTDSLVTFISKLPDSTIVLAAVKDEGSNLLREAQYLALESLGSDKIRDLGLRDSWAMIGTKGAEKGSVPEALSPSGSDPVQIEQALFFPAGASSFGVIFTPEEFTGNNFVVFGQDSLKMPTRLSRVTPGDLFSGQNGADYIIITHPAFKEQAERLAAYRRDFNDFRTIIVFVEDIFNEFNYGLSDPTAIRDFLYNAYQRWQKPAPAYVLLFGDASWDPKKNLSSAYKYDFVPSYGNPVSDTWFVCFDGPEDILPEMSVGRLPVENAAQAEVIVDKIISYESTPSGAWKKNFMFISGGFDKYEQIVFNHQSELLAQDFVNPGPVGGRDISIKKETEGLNEGEHRDDILNVINNGVVWSNFIGHAGSSTWDLMFHNPDIDVLSNDLKFPFITSMTCHTGRFAEPNQDSFGERFLLVSNKGAIGFWGTSGWGYTYEDYQYLRELYSVALQDTVHRLGDAITLAKFGLWNNLGPGQHVRNLILQYNLMGDPAVDLALAEKPDLTIQPADIRVDPQVPSEADSVASIHVKIQNFGLVPRDSVSVQVFAEHLQDGKNMVDAIKSLPPVKLIDSLFFNWKLKDMAGPVNIEAVVDPDNFIDEIDENNNTRSTQVNVISNLIQPVYPVANSICPAGEVVLKVLNPQQKTNLNYFVEFQLDTSRSFNTPLLQSSGPVQNQVLITKWKPHPIDPGLYFWRSKISSDTSDVAWVIGSFYAVGSNMYGWRQGIESQFSKNQFVDTKIINNQASLDDREIKLYVESAGYNDGNYARILINSESPFIVGRGINVAAISGTTGEILFTHTFDTYADPQNSEALAEHINNLPDGSFVLCAIKDEGSASMTENGYLALESIGSDFCRNVGIRDSWAIIGIKGADPGSVPEAHKLSGEGTVSLEDSLILFMKQGTMLAAKIGPAAGWKEFSFHADIPDSTDLSFSVLGHFNGGLADTLLTGLKNPYVDLTGISVKKYHYISLLTDFRTVDGNFTPLLDWLQVIYDPVPDPAIGFDTFSQSADSVLTGETVNLSINIYNIGPVTLTADSLKILFQESDAALGRRTFAVKNITQSVPVDSFITIGQEWSSAGRTGLRQLYISLDPDDKIPELSAFNNNISTFVYVLKDTIKPEIRVTFDGKEVLYGDMISYKPLILARLYDNSPLSFEDTLNVTLFLDDKRVAYGGGTSNLKFKTLSEEGVRGALEYTPVLPEGDHSLHIIAADASGNSVEYRGEFQVVKELKLDNVLNYPNPFKSDTKFTFEISQPAQIRIKIYTVAGRLIQDIDSGWVSAGFNMIPWDGRDADGDELANGVYLYKIFASNGDEKAEQLSKIIVMR
ncbi:T9SS type A sorting domain-containing protein [candidate division KSB1 bacterium]|nr:T9SS type A sorting domain-containing protein [candidate division KSB1 bacterium]